MKFSDRQKRVDRMFEEDEAGGIRQRYDSVEIKALNPLVAAYVGDAYFHLFVRERLLSYEQSKVHVLNQCSAQVVSAVWQARAYRAIASELTAEEQDIFRRGRNAPSHAPRVASVQEYHVSTGFEALLGTLYLTGNVDRLHTLAEAAFQAIARQMMADRRYRT
ncbi:MAG: Mini-ribonuclease 3 [Schwartzia sp. (in: firmicutes)]